VVLHESTIAERKKLLGRLNAERLQSPMVQVEKDYVFDGAEGKRSLADLFGSRIQLIVYHFMFAPEWEKGCPGCTGYVDALGDLPMLNGPDTMFVLVSLAPLAKLEAYKAQRGWSVPWVSSFASDFNDDFHASRDRNVESGRGRDIWQNEDHGHSVFLRLDDDVFHTYSAYTRGTESLMDGSSLFDERPLTMAKADIRPRGRIPRAAIDR
jgi:predicted dithiol-disulfide oxidoreductase (DUF899 family)